MIIKKEINKICYQVHQLFLDDFNGWALFGGPTDEVALGGAYSNDRKLENKK